jgi:hypothetical protein
MTAPFSIEVSDHAYWRAAERFRGFDTVGIEDEILVAFREKRVGPKAPKGITNGSQNDSLYAWTADGHRVYVLRCHQQDERAFVVVTVMRV